MSELTVLALTIVVVLLIVISLFAIIKNQVIRHKLRLPGMSLDIETENKQQQEDSSKTVGVDLGQYNSYESDVKDIAGQDINIDRENQPQNEKDTAKTPGVYMGDGNVFKGKIRNIVGRNINKWNRR